MLQPLFKKELRLAAGPLWLTVICSAILMVFGWDSGQKVWNPVITWLGFGGICSYLIIGQFGSEISLNCLEWEISQPWSRAQYWRQKAGITFGIYGFVVVELIGVAHWLHRGDISRGTITFGEFGLPLGIMSWACFGPGIYLVLKYRNMVASIWLACLLPVGLTLLIAYPSKIMGLSESVTALIIGIVIFLYGALGLWLAWRKFLTWEAGGNGAVEQAIQVRKAAEKDGRDRTYHYRPIRAMLVREFKLQKTNCLLGLGCIFCIAIIIGFNRALPVEAWLGKDFSGMLGLLPEFFRWVVFLIPCTMACSSIAEGRRMDVHACELVAPVGRRLQVFLKMITVMLLGCLVAVVLPLPLNEALHGSFFDEPKYFSKNLVTMNFLLTLLVCFIVIIGCFAASMSGSFLKAFSTALIVISILPPWWVFCIRLGSSVPGLLSLLIPVCLCLGFFTWRTFRNWCRPYSSNGLLRLNVGQCVAVMLFAMMLVWFVNDRSWERFTMSEPTQEASILRPGVQPGTIISWGRNDGYAATVLSPDGTIWLVQDPNNDSHTFGSGPQLTTTQLPIHPPKGYWLGIEGGSLRVAMDSEQRLWSWNASDETNWIRFKREVPLVELGAGRNWSKFAVGVFDEQRVVAIAVDGSLWRFTRSAAGGSMKMEQVDAKLPTHHEYDRESQIVTPIFREPAYDWVDCVVKGRHNFALNEKGMLFAWGRTEPVSAWNRLFIPENELRDLSRYLGRSVHQISGEADSAIIVTSKDGSQWVAAKSLKLLENDGLYKGNLNFPTMYRIKTDRVIHDLTELYNGHIRRPTFRKEDGTLWEIQQIRTELDQSDRRYVSGGGSVVFDDKQIGKRDDWVYKTRSMGITADGKIWNWDLPMQGDRLVSFNLSGWLPPRFRHKVIADLHP